VLSFLILILLNAFKLSKLSFKFLKMTLKWRKTKKYSVELISIYSWFIWNNFSRICYDFGLLSNNNQFQVFSSSIIPSVGTCPWESKCKVWMFWFKSILQKYSQAYIYSESPWLIIYSSLSKYSSVYRSSLRSSFSLFLYRSSALGSDSYFSSFLICLYFFLWSCITFLVFFSFFLKIGISGFSW